MALEVLVADDDPTTVALIEKFIAKVGGIAVTASNGLEALAVLQRETPPQIAYIDWQMPGLNGVKLASQLNYSPLSIRPELVMITSDESEERIHEAMSVGYKAFLNKPITFESFATSYLKAHQNLISQKTLLNNELQRISKVQRQTFDTLLESFNDGFSDPLSILKLKLRWLEKFFDSNEKEETLRVHQFVSDSNRQIERIESVLGSLRSLSLPLSNSVSSVIPVGKGLLGLIDQYQSQLFELNADIIFEPDLSVDDIAVVMPMSHWNHLFSEVFKNAIQALKRLKQERPGQLLFIDVSAKIKPSFIEICFKNPCVSIPLQYQNTLLRPFVSYPEPSQRFGMGFAHIQKIILDMGGEIEVESLNSPFTLKIVLPRVDLLSKKEVA